MFLKSLTVRGFKSFADKTLLEFEPGITVIVGPNGSGKSNIVDALAWALGSHSPKSLRGGAMADVIFAGAPGRPALGRAAVDLTIDNQAGTLPIEFSEVTVSRAMFATGENEYAINASPCRALDVHELLSDTGFGREQHTIVGQGQLDAVLNARPEERRMFIEEAAGILKHRRRKERSVRKLAQMDSHVERLTDVLRELRRTLRPLERQAEAAAKLVDLESQLRDVQIILALRELAALHERWEAGRADDEDGRARLAALEEQLARGRSDEAALEDQLAELAPRARQAEQIHFALANLVERYRGLVGRIDERRRGLVDAVEEAVAGRDPEELRARAAQERAAVEAADAERERAQAALAAAEHARGDAERARRAHEQAAAADARRRAEARERQLRWEGEVSALRSALAQASSEEGRLASQLSGLRSRRAELEHDREAVEREIRRLDGSSGPLAEQLDAAEATTRRRQDDADAAVGAERELERRRASLEARADALRAASQEATEGANTLLAAAEDGDVSGLVGALADHVRVVDGMAGAVAAALGPLGDALVVADADAARGAVEYVRAQRSGRVLLLAANPDGSQAPPSSEQDRDLADLGARPLVDALDADPQVMGGLRRALDGVYVVDDLDTARPLAERHPEATFATRDGDLAGARGWAGGSAAAASAVLSRAAAEQAEAELETVSAELAVAHRRVGDADRALSVTRRELDAAGAALAECEAQLTSAAERSGRLGKELTACVRELDSLSEQSSQLDRETSDLRERLTALEARGVEPAPADPEGPDLEAERLDDVLAAAREHEVASRLALSAVQQRGAEAARRAEALEQEADDVERRLAERERRRTQRLAAIARCDTIAGIAHSALEQAERSLAAAAADRDTLDGAKAERQGELGALRANLREVDAQLTAVRDARHREDLERRDLGHALEAIRGRLREELELDPDAALADHLADAEPDERSDDELTAARDRLVRKIGLLGQVNPLALDEFASLKERHAFLTGQLEDLRGSRRDLVEVIEAVDRRIRDVFAAAFTDVAVQFERMFPRLFPGGEGRLVLTDSDDLLSSGVEVEARPPGKRIKRLSLLSGGERALTALAVLFAIFAARPSPFYVLDEVEAALDDVNLQRFLDIVTEFRDSSQLIIITHQQRTMEVADCLYGVSMQRGGVSKVISQRLREITTTG